MTQVTIVGNLTAPPELRFTAAGKAVASFTIAESHRTRENGEWKETGSTFWNCTLWDAAAENLAESLDKGVRVIAVGEAKQRSFETKQGEKRTVIEVTVSDIGPSLKWSTAKVERTGGKSSGYTKPKPADDPWNAAPADTEDAPF